MLNNEKVFVDPDNSEVDIKTANAMGTNAISQQQYKELQETIIGLRKENDKLKTEWNTKEETLKTLTQKVRDEKTQVEK